MQILIGAAWPYANGSLHIGHLACLLPADVIARYYRAKGDKVCFVSGSDCHGTPVAIRARQEGKSPQSICDHYHREFCQCFKKLGFTFDRYGKTRDQDHQDFVKAFHAALYQSPYVEERQAPQAFCPTCNTALADRFVQGQCPVCGQAARGDQCDACGTVLDPENLVGPVCSLCHTTPQFRQTRHLFIAISRLEAQLTAYLQAHPHWRKNAIAFTRRYIEEGLRDRALTRDLDWGIDVPKPGYEDKKIYIWAENVLGYLSMSQAVAQARGEDGGALWGPDSRHYYVHGKDNIPFHTIILPALLLAQGDGWKLPDEIISSEYLTLEGRKISTSQGWAIWVKDLVDRYHPDAIRYFLIANGPEKRDTDFSWRAFVHSTNGELLGAYGNFINRTLQFIAKYFGGQVPRGTLDPEIRGRIEGLFQSLGTLIQEGRLKEGLEQVFDLVRYANKVFDAQHPWETRETDHAACGNTLYNCVQIIAGLALLLEPFLPFSSAKIRGWLGPPVGARRGCDA